MRNYQLTKRSTELADLSNLPLILRNGNVITAPPVNLSSVAQHRSKAALQRPERGRRQLSICSYCAYEARCRDAVCEGEPIKGERPLKWEVA